MVHDLYCVLSSFCDRLEVPYKMHGHPLCLFIVLLKSNTFPDNSFIYK